MYQKQTYLYEHTGAGLVLVVVMNGKICDREWFHAYKC